MAKRTKRNSSAKEPSFEVTLAELEKAVERLEDGELNLDESLEMYEAGIRHLARCQQLLTAAEKKIELLHDVDADGRVRTERFDEGEMTLDEKAENRSRRRQAQRRTRPTETGGQDDDVDVEGTLF